MALLCQSSSLRDVIAFPKSFHGRDLLTGAPSDIDAKELAEYHVATLSKSI
jgi:aspartyl-tRNA synthetase